MTHLFFPVFVSSTKFKLLKTFFSDIPEILWIKEMENLISWFYVGAKDMAGNTTIHSDIYSVFIPACEKYSARLATCLVSTNKSHVVIICSQCPLIPAKILMGISVRGLAYTMYYDRPSPKMSSKSKEVEVSNQLNLISLCSVELNFLWSCAKTWPLWCFEVCKQLSDQRPKHPDLELEKQITNSENFFLLQANCLFSVYRW